MRYLYNFHFSVFLVLLLSSLHAAAQIDASIQEKPKTGLRYDHYDPMLLNEHALRYLQQGNTSTAKILLQRAVRLAPHNKVILRNLQLVNGGATDLPELVEVAPSIAPASEDTSQQTRQVELLPEPPALWPEK